jgi:hypothetical protein
MLEQKGFHAKQDFPSDISHTERLVMIYEKRNG